MDPSNLVSHASSPRAFRSKVSDDTVGTVANQTIHMTSDLLTPVRDQHQSWGAMKTDIALLVFC